MSLPCSPPPGEPSGQDRERSSKEEGHLLGRSAATPASPGHGHIPHRAEVQDTQGLAPLGKPSTNSPGPKPSMCRGRDVSTLGLDTPQLTTTGHHSGGGSLCDTRPPRQTEHSWVWGPPRSPEYSLQTHSQTWPGSSEKGSHYSLLAGPSRIPARRRLLSGGPGSRQGLTTVAPQP